jgi:virginiamycin A acetyltransferase
MPGIKIGSVSIISSRSVVTSDVPAYSVIGGNPARVIKKRFTDKNILALEKLAWWDWPVERLP